jgi:hypothetical protein
MTRRTAYEIAANPDDVIATHAGPDRNGKYRGFITRGEIRRYKILISTEPVFDTPEAARDAMVKVIADTTAWVENDLKQPGNLVVAMATGEEGAAIGKIITMATAP